MTTGSVNEVVRERVVTSWEKPLTGKEWDRKFPGIFDALSLAGGAANVIMQLSHPAVGYGVKESRVESGSIFKHPVKRTRTTFTYLAVAMLGTEEEKLAYRSAVNGAHRQVYSTEESPVQYRAMDPDLQMWVAACLYKGFVDAYRQFRGAMTPEEEAEFYRLAAPLGTTLQVRANMWPEDLKAFDAYWEQGLQRLQIDDTIRYFLSALVGLKFLPKFLRRSVGEFHRFLTIGFLPPVLREQMHYTWNDAQQQQFDRVTRLIGRAHGVLPRVIRQLPYTYLMWDMRRKMRKGLPLI